MRDWLVPGSMRRLLAVSTIIAACISCPVSGYEKVEATRGTDLRDNRVTCAEAGKPGSEVMVTRTTLAGVPAILRVPRRVTRPPIVLWHGYGPPASEAAMMEALPLDDVPAVKVYLGLPLFGARALAGGTKELVRRQQQDFALLVFKPTVVGAGDELPFVVDALKRRRCMQPEAKIGLIGFSAGGAAALYALSQRKVAIGTVALINPSTGLSASIRALERATGKSYAWSSASRRLAERTDATKRAADIVRGRALPAILLLQGDDDSVMGQEEALALYQGLQPYYREAHSEQSLKWARLTGMSHNWAAGKQSLNNVRKFVSDWYLGR